MRAVPALLVTLLILLIVSTAIQIVRGFGSSQPRVTVYYCTPECTLGTPS